MFQRQARKKLIGFNVWDTTDHGLVLRVQPTGHCSFRFFYPMGRAKRWVKIGSLGKITLEDVRTKVSELRLKVRQGEDPAANLTNTGDTFEALARRYVREWSEKHNKSWRQAAGLVDRYLIPCWGKLAASSISRKEVNRLHGSITAPVLANQVLAAASAVFSWGIKQDIISVNPCHGVERNKTTERERVLTDSELPLFWEAFDDAGLIKSSALKVILLTGQRPGEVSHMRMEHIRDGWWEMPGEPVPALGWPGTKNGKTHNVWLTEPVREIIAELSDGSDSGYVFSENGRPVDGLDEAMRLICKRLGVSDRVRPHDLRRTFSTRVAALFDPMIMDRLINHKEGGVRRVYNRHHYRPENQRVMEAVATHIMGLAHGREQDSKVVALHR
jgi:integrase